MMTITKTAIVALMTTTIGLSAIAPSFAQGNTQTQSQAQSQPGAQVREDSPRPRHMMIRAGRMGSGDFLSLERGVEAVEIALVRLSHRIDLTGEQQPLFDAFKAAALSAATDLATATEGLRPTPPAQGESAAAPDLSERLENRISIERARLAALESIQPAATAFFDSLTDEQKALLSPKRLGRDGTRDGFGKFGGPRQQGKPAASATAPASVNG